jgi:hypothetical protein
VHRFLAEYQSTRDAPKTWWRKCLDRKVVERYPCPSPDSLDSFLQCPNNPAANRMIRMLAHSSCSFTRIPQELPVQRYLLDSAMMTLGNHTFVGIDEYVRTSDGLLSYSFGVPRSTEQSEFGLNSGLMERFNVTERQLKEIVRLNHLDMQIYYHAMRILAARAEYLGVEEGLFAEVEFPTDLPGAYDSALQYFIERKLFLPK